MVKPELGKLEIFDSLGAGSKIGLIKENLKFRTNQSIVYNDTPFQMADSHSCGLFAIYFAVERMFNLDLPFIALLEDIFDFENKLENNENIVKQFCEMIIE
jgi:hypothetical protein